MMIAKLEQFVYVRNSCERRFSDFLALGLVGAYILEKQERAILDNFTGAQVNPDGLSSRNLVVSASLFILFLVIGIVFFTAVSSMSLVDSLYFSVVTLTTVGEFNFKVSNPKL